MHKVYISLVLCAVFISSSVAQPLYDPDPAKWRPINGFGHNPLYPNWGTPGSDLLRMGPAFYGDDISTPRTAFLSGNPLPSARFVSDKVFTNPYPSIPASRRGLTDFVTYWGQFLDHDFTLTSGDPNGFANPPQSMPIAVPTGDAFFDPEYTGTATLPFLRGIANNASGTSAAFPLTGLNLVTSWFDGSQVYGSDAVTAAYLRTFSGGLLKTFMYNGDEYPILNDGGLVMQSAGIQNQSNLFLFGDVRGNENPGLTALQILFVREHNRKARELAVLYPTWTDEQLYQECRKLNIAIMHHITEEEYFPVILGEHFEEFTVPVTSLSPNIYEDFSTGAFRYGHSEVNSFFLRLNSAGTSIPEGPLKLMNSYFNPIQSILSAGVDPILRGMFQQKQGAVDTVFVNDLRNYLFGAPGSGGMDLTAINIQRGRDHGLPGFNTYRDNYDLPAYTSWSQINPDPLVWQALANTYESIDDCDVYVCGLAETPYNSLSNVGQTFHAAIREQYKHLRDSDPAWYEADGYLTAQELTEARATGLADLILRNTHILRNELPCFVMALPDGCGMPIAPPVATYDFLVTVVNTTMQNPLFGNENMFSFAINGVDGVNVTVQRGKNYTFYAQVNCNHAFYIATSADVVVPPFAPAYDKVVNQFACLHQNPMVTLTVDDTTPSILYYHCGLHNFMGGIINVVGAPPVMTTGTPQVGTTGSPVSATTGVPVVAPPITSNNGAIAGLTAAVVILAIIVVLGAVYFVWSRKRNFVVLKEDKVELH